MKMQCITLQQSSNNNITKYWGKYRVMPYSTQNLTKERRKINLVCTIGSTYYNWQIKRFTLWILKKCYKFISHQAIQWDENLRIMRTEQRLQPPSMFNEAFDTTKSDVQHSLSTVSSSWGSRSRTQFLGQSSRHK